MTEQKDIDEIIDNSDLGCSANQYYRNDFETPLSIKEEKIVEENYSDDKKKFIQAVSEYYKGKMAEAQGQAREAIEMAKRLSAICYKWEEKQNKEVISGLSNVNFKGKLGGFMKKRNKNLEGWTLVENTAGKICNGVYTKDDGEGIMVRFAWGKDLKYIPIVERVNRGDL